MSKLFVAGEVFHGAGSLEELKKETWRITEIYLNAKGNFNYCYYL